MIHSLTVTNHLDETVKVDLRNPFDTGFLIYNIDGLGPGVADIKTSAFAVSDGGVFNTARRDVRNIVITFRLGHAPTIEASRLRAYRYFGLKREVTLEIQTDKRLGRISGYVEKVEPVIFTNDAHMQVSIICPDPYFYEVGGGIGGNGEIGTEFYSVVPRFEFEYYTNINEPKVVSDIVRYEEGNVHYSGDVDVGFIMEVNISGDVKNLKIFDRTDQAYMGVDHDRLVKLTGSGLKNGDMLTISTIPGQKTITLLRAGKSVNIINCLDRHTSWFKLTPGDNVFTFDAESGSGNVELKIRHRIAYEGL